MFRQKSHRSHGTRRSMNSMLYWLLIAFVLSGASEAATPVGKLLHLRTETEQRQPDLGSYVTRNDNTNIESGVELEQFTMSHGTKNSEIPLGTIDSRSIQDRKLNFEPDMNGEEDFMVDFRNADSVPLSQHVAEYVKKSVDVQHGLKSSLESEVVKEFEKELHQEKNIRKETFGDKSEEFTSDVDSLLEDENQEELSLRHKDTGKSIRKGEDFESNDTTFPFSSEYIYNDESNTNPIVPPQLAVNDNRKPFVLPSLKSLNVFPIVESLLHDVEHLTNSSSDDKGTYDMTRDVDSTARFFEELIHPANVAFVGILAVVAVTIGILVSSIKPPYPSYIGTFRGREFTPIDEDFIIPYLHSIPTFDPPPSTNFHGLLQGIRRRRR